MSTLQFLTLNIPFSIVLSSVQSVLISPVHHGDATFSCSALIHLIHALILKLKSHRLP